MRNQDYQRQLNHEQATNEHYIRTQEQRQIRRRELARGIATTRSATWTDTAPHTRELIRRIYPLIGRVALIKADEDLGTDYYISDAYLSHEYMNTDSCVISWAAPAAKIFFRGQHSEWAFPNPSSLTARRTFSHSPTDQIMDYDDQLENGVEYTDVFHVPSPDKIPPPPQSTEVSKSPPVILHKDEVENRYEQEYDMTDAPSSISRTFPDPPEQLRAERLVNISLDAPRTGQLPLVLNTLQPDQYRFVTWPADTPLLLQGAPGTGKTVVAAYRALYLTHPENTEIQSGTDKKLALVGPTQAWSHHVRDLLSGREASTVTCINLEELIWSVSKGPRHALHHSRQSRFKVDWAIYSLALRATRQLKREGKLDINKKKAVKQVLEVLINDTAIHRKVTDREHSQWLLSIPSYSQARKWPDCLLLFAAISVAFEQTITSFQNPFPLNHYDHIIVDEAQDVRGVEWAILDQMIIPNGTWTIIGDMNQRRADYTFSSWRELIDKLETGDADLDEEEVLTVGYRSTRQIMQFAANLIDQPEQWRVKMLRDGPDVIVEQTTINRQSVTIMNHINRLTAKYQQGTVGIIGIALTDIERHIKRDGWRREPAGPLFHKDQSRSLMLADPIQARGLEFDAVIVVEPTGFPTNLGRNGPLYTSLTRAHQELVIVHARPLPKKLRGRARRL